VSDFKTIAQSFKVQDNLCPDIWYLPNEKFMGDSDAQNEKMKPEIRERLIEIAIEFIEFLNVDIFIEDIIMTGSLSNYNWSEFSDVDLHIISDFDNYGENKDLYEDLFRLKKNYFNLMHDIKIKGFDVELYVQNATEPHFSTGVYSVMNDEWIEKPKKEEVVIDNKKLKEKTENWMSIIDELVRNLEDEEIDVAKDVINKHKEKLRNYRTSGLNTGGEYSYENLVYKVLRRNGYLEKLQRLENNIIDKKLSLKENELYKQNNIFIKKK
jgi:hypothetical protein